MGTYTRVSGILLWCHDLWLLLSCSARLPAVKSLTVTDFTDTSARVYWEWEESRSAPNINSVTVVVKNMRTAQEQDQIVSRLSVPWGNRSTRVEGLYPGMKYRVFLTAPDEDEESAEPASGMITKEFTLPCK